MEDRLNMWPNYSGNPSYPCPQPSGRKTYSDVDLQKVHHKCSIEFYFIIISRNRMGCDIMLDTIHGFNFATYLNSNLMKS